MERKKIGSRIQNTGRCLKRLYFLHYSRLVLHFTAGHTVLYSYRLIVPRSSLPPRLQVSKSDNLPLFFGFCLFLICREINIFGV